MTAIKLYVKYFIIALIENYFILFSTYFYAFYKKRRRTKNPIKSEVISCFLDVFQ